MDQKQVVFHSKNISYRITGKGKVLVLIHGYMASSEVWEPLVKSFRNNFLILTPDLPGHGKSECLSEIPSMEILAEAVNSILQKENIQRISIAGHSMGGYVALAFAELFPDKIENLILINSHPFADNLEKQINRVREIEMLKKGKKNLLVHLNISENFNPDRKLNFSKEIEKLFRIAMEIDKVSLIASLNGMKIRKDRSFIMSSQLYKFIWFLGKHDQKINYKEMISLTERNQNVKLITMENSGHMGIIEEEEFIYQTLVDTIL
jgi:pimeloyl-ACP methyl ester carboxylesterase